MAFSEIEKKNIRERLLANCEESWSTFGYKKTSVDELCQKAGISKGSFYLFFDSKEDLFCQVMIEVQERLIAIAKRTLTKTPTKHELAETLKLVFREYSSVPFLTETQSPDFVMFINRLSPEKLEELEEHGSYDIQDIIRESGLTYRIEEQKGLSALALIFRPMNANQQLPWDYLEVFDFTLDTLIEKIFE
ncbi:hypothetical protein IGI37_000184 [Enterococcus sp. AZ194]|uniref:TetR/AcrR family transcriptional regulator n=1 Tax=Enterococcus sp. AZ194 TaxID=2774629 RepID=UPI003F20C0C4